MGGQESPQLIERKTQVDTDAQEASRASKYFETIGHILKKCPLLESSSLPLVSQTSYGPGSPATV